MAESNTTTKNKPAFESMAHKSPTSYTAALKGINFPSDVNGLVETAKGNHASDEIIAVLKKMPDGEYRAMIDVTFNLGKVL